MARRETDREDLIREATALVERAELVCTSVPSIVTAGFRKDGQFSVYFEQDPFYQFDPDGLLRRAYVNGFLYRSQLTTLALLDRQREDGRTTLLRRDLSCDELEGFRQQMREQLTPLLDDLRTGRFHTQRRVPEDVGIVGRLTSSLTAILALDDQFLSNSIRARR